MRACMWAGMGSVLWKSQVGGSWLWKVKVSLQSLKGKFSVCNVFGPVREGPWGSETHLPLRVQRSPQRSPNSKGSPGTGTHSFRGCLRLGMREYEEWCGDLEDRKSFSGRCPLSFLLFLSLPSLGSFQDC